MTKVSASVLSVCAMASVCLGGGDVSIGFEAYPPGSLLPSHVERGVLFTPQGPAGLMSATVHPTEGVSVFDASADVDAPLRADLPEQASAVEVSFVATVNAVVYVDAFDEDGFQVASEAAFGADTAFEVVTVRVEGLGITRVEFGGFGEGASSTPTFVYTPSVAPCNVADLAPPRGVLDFSDVFEFLTLFGAGGQDADLGEPFGVLDFSDVFAFLVAFGGGCP